ncbi:protein smax1-like 4 [Quercus suber]|uniref:Protein smax1-like 4 n=1 Tax=Quercus suber TaxID=58331 RepID=A0AAW0M8D5_QUESU
MRSGACAAQQTLTAEAASVLKHSVSLARRRGHAQVTPLHVAATLLSARASVLRRACLKSQPHHTSHPLQCRALELCFNVALNRLPTTPDIINPSTFWNTPFLAYSSEQNPVLFSPPKKLPTNNPITGFIAGSSPSVKEDIKLVFDVLSRKNNNKRKNTVIVGDSVPITEGLVSELMSRLERGEVPEELKSTHVIRFQFAPVSLRFMKKEDVEMKLSELKRKVDYSLASAGGAIIYTGDLKWTVNDEKEEVSVSVSSTYNPVDHLVAEIGRLVSDFGSSNSNAKVWLMGTASYQTYMRCQIRQPPLELQWALQAVSVPSGGLGLSLQGSSVLDSKLTFSLNPSQLLETKPFSCKEERDKLSCCSECASSYEKEAQLFKSGELNLLPPWLQPHGTEASHKDELVELQRKWNGLCHSLHQGRHGQNHMNSTLYSSQSLFGKNKSYSYVSSYPWWPSQNSVFPEANSISFADSALKCTHSSNLVSRLRRQQSCTIEFNFTGDNQKHQSAEPSLGFLKDNDGQEVKITLALEKLVERKSERTIKRADTCKVLQENVPWQSETIPSIAEALIDSKFSKQETWLLIQGNDSIGKRRLALAIAESIFGSADLLLHLNMRKRDNAETPCPQILANAMKTHGKLVILVEDVDLADTQFMKFLADVYESGKFGESSKREEGSTIGQVIFILTKGGSTSYENKNKKDCVIKLNLQVNETKPSLGTFNFDHKRKAEWDLLAKTKKTPRMEAKEDASCVAGENGNIKKDFSRQSSFNSTLDLNIRADEEVESEGKPGEYSPISKEVLVGSASFPNSLFEKWLKDIFQTSLQTFKVGGKEGIEVRLCLEGKGEGFLEDGFMGSCLPKKIYVSFIDY